jgi:hypothetical protein
MTGLEVVAGYLARWAWQRARKLAGRVVEKVDDKVDAALERLYDTVAARLSGDSAMKRLEREATADLDAEPAVSAGAAEAVRYAVESAADEDPAFARQVEAALAEVRTAMNVSASGHGIAAAGNVHIQADHGSIAAGTIHGSVTLNPPPPGTGQA